MTSIADYASITTTAGIADIASIASIANTVAAYALRRGASVRQRA